MLWLGLCLPRLPLEVFERAGAARANECPLALCDRLVVLQPGDAAAALGVHAGMKRATALALVPRLCLRERDPARERDALRQVACWALQFTPAVSLQSDEPGLAGVAPADSGLLLEVEASLRLFGGREALLARIRGGLAELGFNARVACAPTPSGAWLLARHRDGACALDAAQLNARLAALPVVLLEHARAHLATLESIGARSLKDLAQLPRAGLARRFGKALLVELDRAFGRQADPRPWFEAPPRFDARLELLAQVDDAQALLFAARRLVAQLAGWLAARHAAVRSLEFVAEHDDLPPTPIALRFADGTRDADRITALLREKLAVTQLPAAAHTLGLHCDEVSAQAGSSAQLFPVPESAREGLGRLIERLQARLGREQVRRLLLAEDHRPEAAYRFETVDAAQVVPAAASPPAAAGAGALPRPLWLLRSPVALGERNNRPYWNGPLTLLAGPERIESGWWDGALVQRDYFVASDTADMLLWIYRERVPDADAGPGWFIHGRFG